MTKRALNTRVGGLLWVSLAALGCGSDTNNNLPITGTAGTIGGVAGAVAGTSGLAGTGAAGRLGTAGAGLPPRAGTGAAGTAVTAGTGAAGSGVAGAAAGSGAAGAAAGAGGAAAGAGGAAGMVAGGAGGAGGTAGAPPAGDCGPEAFACRGDAPTMASALGTAKGPYATMSYTSGMRNGPDYGAATVYYPTGDAKPPFGCVTVVPGFTALQSSIRQWGPFLASHGIITMTIDTNTTSDPPATRANALMDSLETCVAENDRMGSPIMGKVAKDHLGVAGWSMGGGGTLIAAAANPTLKAATSFAAWGPTGGANNKVPALMFEATADVLAASMSDSYYAATPETTPKMLFEVSGSSHNVANSPTNHEGIIGLYGLSWWKVFMEGDTRYKQFLIAAKPSITTSKFKTNVK